MRTLQTRETHTISLANNQAVTAERYHFTGAQPLRLQANENWWAIQGDSYRLAWTGGSGETTLDVWTVGPEGWHLEQASVAVADDGFTWQDQEGLPGGRVPPRQETKACGPEVRHLYCYMPAEDFRAYYYMSVSPCML